MQLGATIRAERIRLGLTQEKLARKAGVLLRTLQRVEKGRGRADTLDAVFSALEKFQQNPP